MIIGTTSVFPWVRRSTREHLEVMIMVIILITVKFHGCIHVFKTYQSIHFKYLQCCVSIAPYKSCLDKSVNNAKYNFSTVAHFHT